MKAKMMGALGTQTSIDKEEQQKEAKKKKKNNKDKKDKKGGWAKARQASQDSKTSGALTREEAAIIIQACKMMALSLTT